MDESCTQLELVTTADAAVVCWTHESSEDEIVCQWQDSKFAASDGKQPSSILFMRTVLATS